MKFKQCKMDGLWMIEPQPLEDSRGFFARMVCEREFAEHGLPNEWKQQDISFNRKKGTLRGLHYQKAPYREIKVIRCTQGAIFDVAVDLRKDSPTYLEWLGVALTADNRCMFFVPEGFAHGYLTLEDNSEVSYLMSEFYTPDAAAGLRYDDPKLGIKWPEIGVQVISEKDAAWPYLDE